MFAYRESGSCRYTNKHRIGGGTESTLAIIAPFQEAVYFICPGGALVGRSLGRAKAPRDKQTIPAVLSHH